MPICCSERCDTAFCPHCGALVNNRGPLNGLLRHVNTQAQAARRNSDRRVARYRHLTQEDGVDRSHKITKASKAADKWQGWLTALSELMDLDTDSET